MKTGNLEDCKQQFSKFLEEKDRLNEMGERSIEIIEEWSFENIKKSVEENCFK